MNNELMTQVDVLGATLAQIAHLTKQVDAREIFAAIRDVHAGKSCGAKGVRPAAAAPVARDGHWQPAPVA